MSAKSNKSTGADIERSLRRRKESLDYLQLVTKTFVSLSLTDRQSICDTLGSMVGTFLGANTGFTLIRKTGEDEMMVAGAQGV